MASEPSDGNISRIELPNSKVYEIKDETARAGIGSVRIWHGTCSTAASTGAKTVTIANLTKLQEGDLFLITFTAAQTYNGVPTLNINNLGAHSIRRSTAGNAARYEWIAGETIPLLYDKSYFLILDGAIATTTYYGVTKLSNSATSTGTSLALVPASLNSIVQNVIADYPVYSASETYTIGDRVRHDFNIWECTVDIATAEAWDAEHWKTLNPLQEQIDSIERLPAHSASHNGQVLTVSNNTLIWADSAVQNAYVYKGSVATKTALPSSGQAVGHVYLVEDEEKKYTWNGSEWEVFGSGGGDSDPYATTEEIDALFDYELLAAEEASF